jgi:hypothetical protein
MHAADGGVKAELKTEKEGSCGFSGEGRRRRMQKNEEGERSMENICKCVIYSV